MRYAIIALMLGTTTLFAGSLSAEPKKEPKPVLCVRGSRVPVTIDGESLTAFLCMDAKKPRILTRWWSVTMSDEQGSRNRVYVLGWTTGSPQGKEPKDVRRPVASIETM